jgi:hypothetical protein
MTIEFESQPRDRLYFDQYQYCVSFELLHSGRSRTLVESRIRENVHFANTISRSGASWHKKITEQQEQNLVDCAKIFKNTPHQHKRIVYSHNQYIYTNSPELVQTLLAQPFLSQLRCHQANVVLPRDVVVLKTSKYKFRSFFSNRWFQKHEVEAIRNFLISRGQQFRTTRGVTARLSHEFFYPANWMFVDHMDEKDAFLMNIVASQCIRKTMPIEIAK